MTRPVKSALPEYKNIEKGLETVIYEKWLGGITAEEYAAMREIDDVLLYHEFLRFMGEKLWETSRSYIPSRTFSSNFSAEWKKSLLPLFLACKQLAKQRREKTGRFDYHNFHKKCSFQMLILVYHMKKTLSE